MAHRGGYLENLTPTRLTGEDTFLFVGGELGQKAHGSEGLGIHRARSPTGAEQTGSCSGEAATRQIADSALERLNR